MAYFDLGAIATTALGPTEWQFRESAVAAAAKAPGQFVKVVLNRSAGSPKSTSYPSRKAMALANPSDDGPLVIPSGMGAVFLIDKNPPFGETQVVESNTDYAGDVTTRFKWKLLVPFIVGAGILGAAFHFRKVRR